MVSLLSPNGKVYYGTFINSQASIQKMVRAPGFFRDYAFVSDMSPIQEGNERIYKAWADSQGSAWFQAYATVTTGPKAGLNLQVLQKISGGGTALEFTWKEISEFCPNDFPMKIDKEDSCHYGSYVRVAE